MVLGGLLVASMVGLALIETILTHHRQMHIMSRQQQCFWLAEAGVERAVRKLADSPDYRGETWEVSADVLGIARPAVVTIEVTKAAESSETREIRSEARFPGDPVQRNAYQRKLTVSIPPEDPTSPDDTEQ